MEKERVSFMKKLDSYKKLLYREGYVAAFRDFKEHLEYSFSGFKSDRKRNNVQNVIWLIDSILENIDVFQQYGRDTPIHFEYDSKSKKCHYYVKMDEWPTGKKDVPGRE